jgi:hypothetical protein
MKKILTFLLSAALVLSLAAVSLAAVTVAGDFRYDMYEDEGAVDSSGNPSDNSYANTDLRVRVSGDLSESVFATANFQWKRGSNNDLKTNLDEFYATWTQPWGLAKMGYYEYKFTPSRVELKSGGYHVWKKNDATFEVNIPLAEGFTVDGIFQPYAENEQGSGSYGAALNYKAENWGAKLTYADFKQDLDLAAIDVYYMFNENMKLFIDAVDYSGNDTSAVYDDGFDPVIGFAWDKIANTKLYASCEYALNPRNKDLATEYDEYVLKAAYKLENNIGLEFYHFVIGDDLNKEQFRLRYQF